MGEHEVQKTLFEAVKKDDKTEDASSSTVASEPISESISEPIIPLASPLHAQTVSPVSDGAYFTVQASGCEDLGGLVAGSKYKIAVDVAYYAATSSSAFSHSVNGELFANVEEG